MNIVDVIICALAAFRLAELVVIDDGPFEVFFHVRGWAHKPPTDTPVRGTLASLLSCVHCTGLWMAIAVGLLYVSGIPALHLVVFVLAIAGLQSILAGKLGRS